ncbi:hypothetical protein HPB49_009895 [Dermacentor silvarum]|uniref:Uncharacterized protein n=1 Tax=Dermacentor silvarum TaxID=543639 RepID=A0ACB8DCT7_DERSI|nr:hypothetical protein HPB49_009895 [Dermacentor silvarum]
MADQEALAALRQQVQHLQDQLQAQQQLWSSGRHHSSCHRQHGHTPTLLGLVTRGVDQTRYDYVVAHLDSRYATELRDVLACPPADDCYLHLKRQLIRRLSPSDDEKAILQVQPNLPLDKLAEIADRVVEASPPPPPLFVHATGPSQPTPELASRIDEIARQVYSMQRNLDQRPALRPGKHPQSRGRNTDSWQENDDGRCYYHRRFGDRARKCQPRCSVGRQGNFNSSP